MTYDNSNRGSIWKNDDKQNDNHPDFKGSLNVNGVDYWVSAWKRKEGASPKAPALSFSIKPKEVQPRPQQHHSPGRANPISSGLPGGYPHNNDLNDDVPF